MGEEAQSPEEVREEPHTARPPGTCMHTDGVQSHNLQKSEHSKTGWLSALGDHRVANLYQDPGITSLTAGVACGGFLKCPASSLEGAHVPTPFCA